MKKGYKKTNPSTMPTGRQASSGRVSVKPGYKVTRVGVIPEDWEVVAFEDIADKNLKYSITGGPFGSNLKVSDYADEGVRIIQLQNIGDGRFNNGYKIYTSIEKADELKSCNIYPGEIILSKMGDPVARACFLPEVDSRYVMASDGIRLVPDEKLWDKKFVLEYINYSSFRNIAKRRSTGSTRQRIGLTDLKRIPVINPPLPEQKKIAEILSKWDEAIEKQQDLIKKKKKLKKGLMQQLLTGKRRFPEFTVGTGLKPVRTERFKDTKIGEVPEDWEVVEFEKLTGKKGIVRGPFGGALKKDFFVKSGYKVYEQKNAIYKSTKLGRYYIDEVKYKELERFALKGGDFIVSCSGTIGSIFQIPKDFEKGLINQALLKITLKEKLVNADYFYQQFNSTRFQHSIIESTQGGAMKNMVGMSEFRKKKFPLPPLPEQKKIAEVLSSADKEIELLGEELEGLKEQKKGLMQKLLTGEVRVKI